MFTSQNIPNCIHDELNKLETTDTETDNGAPAYSTTNSKLLDLFTESVRGIEKDDLINMFINAFSENNLLSLACVAHLRDIRKGKGERDIVRHIMLWLRKNHYRTYILNLPYITSIGYYKDLLNIVQELSLTNEDDNPIELILMAEQLTKDLATYRNKSEENISLAAKWAPSSNTYYDYNKNGNQAYRLSKIMFPNSKTPQKDYRLAISSLRKHLNIVERLMCLNNWSEINFSHVPSKAHFNLKKIFSRHQEERYADYLSALTKGDPSVKINTTGMEPHTLVDKYLCDMLLRTKIQYDAVVESQWETIVQKLSTNGTLEDSLAIVDVSGSMVGKPMTVAIALGLITSKLTKEPFRDHCITFSNNPQMHKIIGSNLLEQVTDMKNMEWGANTDLLKVFKLILDKSIKNNLPDEQNIKKLFIFTDMQFDSAEYTNWDTTYENIKNMYAQYNYTVPNIIFWNLAASKKTFPCTKDIQGVALVSGFSPELLVAFMDNIEFTPFSMMMKILEPYANKIIL